jgi:hypothetical protein
MTVPLDRASEGWVNQMIADARKRNPSVCIQVSVQEPAVQLALSTPGCSAMGGGGRRPNSTEQRIIDEWNRRGLGMGRVIPGELRAFLNELARLL